MNISEYIKSIMPQGAFNTYVFLEDFDGDGQKEAILIYSEETASMPLVSVIWIRPVPGQPGSYTSLRIMYTGHDPDSLYDLDDDVYGGVSGAYAEDVDKDAYPELVVGLIAGSGHFLTVYVIKWIGGDPVLIYRAGDYPHGKFSVIDIEGDRRYEIVVEYSTYAGEEFLIRSEAGPHVRESLVLQWTGGRFQMAPYTLGDADECFRVGVAFVSAIWKRDFWSAYRMVALPQFLGVDGMADCLYDDCYLAFVAYLREKVVPVLQANLAEGPLTPADPASGYCWFEGELHLITVSLQRVHGRWMVSGIEAREHA